MLIVHIETPRLRIRSFQRDDWQAVYDYTGERARAFAVLLKADDTLVGHMVFHPWFAPLTYEIGWVFDRANHGHGYATEAATALLQYGFEALRLHRIIATCQPENVASYRVMEKLGMRREAHFRRCIRRPNNAWWDEYFYTLLEEEWFEANKT